MAIFFQKNNKSESPLCKSIEAACEGLIYISETDAPVTAFCGRQADDVTEDIILQQAGLNADEPIEEVSFDDFFVRLTAIREWYGEPEKEKAKKFAELQRLLEENLRQRKVFRVGKIRVGILAVGLDKDRCLMGVTTEAVET